jgi:hypothetical protein
MTFRVHQQQSSASSLNKHFAERKRFYARALSYTPLHLALARSARPHFSALEGLIVGLEDDERASERLRSQSAPNAAEIGDWLAESGIHSNSLLALNSLERQGTL